MPTLTMFTAWVGKKLLPLLTPTNIIRLITAVLLLIGIYMIYDAIYDRAYAAGQKDQKELSAGEVAAANKARDDANKDKEAAQAELKTYKDTYDLWYRTTRVENERIAKENAELAARLRTRLVAAEERARRYKELADDIQKYIPASADTYLPLGFVSLYNLSLEAPSAAAVDQLSFGAEGNVGTLTPVTLSQFASVSVWNNAEAVRRGVIIRQWQEWYTENKKNFDEAQQRAAENIPRVMESERETSR